MSLSSQFKKILAILKLIQLLRKYIYRHLYVSVINTVSLKGIEQLVFEQWTFGFFQVFQIYRHLCKTVKNLVVNTWYEVVKVTLSLVSAK